MAGPAASVEALLDLAIRHVNAGQRERARLLCEHAVATHPPHPGVLQLFAMLELQRGGAALASQLAQASLDLRPDHLPTLRLSADAARRAGDPQRAEGALARIVVIAPDQADAWFQLSLLRQDRHDLAGAVQALQQVLRIDPARAEAHVNLGIVLQDSGQPEDALRAYGRAYRLREDTFGRIAHALATPNVGRMWLDLDALRAALRATAP
jgi:tetratricopeptide (TPR) repeat protein